jgi:hypothetical protein
VAGLCAEQDSEVQSGAQGEAEQDGHSVNGRPAERDCHGRQSPEFQAKREREA